MAHYSAARHALVTGQPLADLAILGCDSDEATDRLAAAAGRIDTDNTVGRAICLAKLASLTMVTGDPLQAAAIGYVALDVAGFIRPASDAKPGEVAAFHTIRSGGTTVPVGSRG